MDAVKELVISVEGVKIHGYKVGSEDLKEYVVKEIERWTHLKVKEEDTEDRNLVTVRINGELDEKEVMRMLKEQGFQVKYNGLLSEINIRGY